MGKDFITKTVLWPEGWSAVFYAGKVEFNEGKSVEREIVLHVRQPEGDPELPDDSLPEDAEDDEGD